MIKRILGILSYVGMLLVFGALAVRFLKPEWDQYAIYAAWSGLALVVLYTLGQWREIVAYFRQRNARYGAIASVSVLVFLGILVAVNYLSTRRNKRWDLTANKQYSLSEQTVKLLQGLKAPVKFMVFDQEAELRALPAAARRATRTTRNRCRSNTSTPTSSPVQTKQYNVDTYGTVVIEYMGRTRARHVRLRAGPDQRADQAAESAAAEGLLPERTRREGPSDSRPRRDTAASPTR